jgi:hypothetical protein
MAHVLTSYGEIVDKYTILQLKQDKITDPQKLVNVHREFETLKPFVNKLQVHTGLDALLTELRAINGRLWIIEDNLRLKEQRQEFDAEFIALARSAYKTNDQRSQVKYTINQLTESTLCEEKSHA